MNGMEIVQRAKEQLQMLTGLHPDTVSKLKKEDDGWHVVIELLELKVVPDSKDILATYATILDAEGNIVSYERINRYRRGEVG
ncbi:MAG: gas vesicle protein [Oscillochloris sp.]|nr:gas vesicle protein [Oscillochloris sp.]